MAVCLVLGCVPRLQALPPIDPGVDFAAHVEHRGLVVDEMVGGSPAALVPAGGLPWSGGPQYLLQEQDKTIAALWFPSPGHMIVRQSADPQSPLLGQVEAVWTDGAIHLTLEPANGAKLQTGAFNRIDGRVATAALSSQARTVLDLRGIYRAQLRDANGETVGWLRAQLSPHRASPRIYDGRLPESVNGPLTTAAVALLDYDVDYLEDHAVDVYQGN